MKNNVKKIILFFAFTSLLFIAVFFSYKIVKWKDTTGNYCSSIEQLYNTDDNLIDVVFVGSSQVYCDVYPCFLWEKAGISSFDMSVSGQDKVSSYYELKELLKTQSPEVVFVDLYGLFSEGNAIEGNRYRNLLSMKPSLNSYNHVKDFFEGDSESNVNDYLFRFPIVHTRYKELTRLDFENYVPNTFLRGEQFIFQTNWAAPSPTKDSYNPEKLSDSNLKWLNDLYNLSIENSFNLVLMKTPFYDAGTDQNILDGASVFASEKGLDFIDFNKIADELGLDYSFDFYDGNHTNAYGARKISKYLSNYIKDKYPVPDHRGDSRYSQWDDDLQFFYREEAKNEIKNEPDIYALSSLLNEYKTDFSAIISIEYTSSIGNNIDTYKDGLGLIGMEYDDIITGGKWLYRNGQLTLLADNDPELSATIYELNKYDTIVVKYKEDGSAENVMIGPNDYSNVGTYISITVYDELLKEVVINKQF